MRVALGGADGQSRRCRDLVERRVERVLERDDARLGRGQLGEARAELASRLGGGERPRRVAVPRDARVLEQRLRPPLGRPARLGDVLARVDDQAVQPGRELRVAAELLHPAHELDHRFLGGIVRILGVAQDVERDPVDAIRMAGAQRREGELVSVFDTSYENGVREPFVDERPIRAQVSTI